MDSRLYGVPRVPRAARAAGGRGAPGAGEPGPADLQAPLVKRSRLELELLASLVAGVMSGRDDLLRPAYRGRFHPLAGHCYVAAEALYHLGAGAAGYRPESLRWEGGIHWRLRNLASGLILDPTAAQFQAPPPPHLGRGRGFLTGKPSARALVVLRDPTLRPYRRA